MINVSELTNGFVSRGNISYPLCGIALDESNSGFFMIEEKYEDLRGLLCIDHFHLHFDSENNTSVEVEFKSCSNCHVEEKIRTYFFHGAKVTIRQGE